MSRTYVKKKCKNCGYSVSEVVGSYIKEPLGIPLAFCPRCGKIMKDSDRKEWVQMSPLRKFYAINPKGIMYALTGTLVAMLVMYLIMDAKLGEKFSEIDTLPDETLKICLFLSVAGIFLILYYVFTRIAVNKGRFINLYKQSVKRTRNEKYRKLLEPMGKVYDESLPFGLHFSAYNQKQIDYELSHIEEDVKVIIPSLDDSIMNV